MNFGADPGTVCVPAPPAGDDAVFGDTLLRHTKAGRVTITGLELVDAERMSIREAYLVRLRVARGDSLVGIRYASDTADMPEQWDQRVPAEGATLRAGEEWNLAVVVDTPQKGTSSAQAVRITYENADGTFHQDTLSSMTSTDQPCEDVLERGDDPDGTSSS